MGTEGELVTGAVEIQEALLSITCTNLKNQSGKAALNILLEAVWS